MAVTEPEIIDGTALDVADESSKAVVQSRPALAVTPQVPATELVARLDVISEAMTNAMREDVDYGRIPGTNKPTLLKPGAEKLSVLFQLDLQLDNEKKWGPDDHLTVISQATAFHAPTGARLGYGEGVCSTRETKYAYRNEELTCPECGKQTVKKSRKRQDGSGGDGWYCWKKPEKGFDGCGANFPGTDQRISEQKTGRIDNPDLPDLWNTIVKMAEKRARVDAVLAVTGASALFTQDAEDHAGPVQQEGPPHGEPADKTTLGLASTAAVNLCEGDQERARRLWEAIKGDLGYMPQSAAVALVRAATASTGHVEAPVPS